MYQRSLSPSHGDALGIMLIVISSVFLGLAAFAVAIRLWSRKIQRHGLFLNDYAAVLAWIFAASLVTTSIIEIVYYGSGKHLKFLDLANIAEILKAYLATDIAWAAANTSIRISIVHFYITIFRSNKAFLKVTYAVIVLVSAFGAGIVISDFLTCRPLAKYWNPLRPGICENPIESAIALSSCNVAIDLIIVLLPMPLVWGLHMATRRKVELTIVFALGILVCVVTVIRVIFSAQLDLDDYTYGITRIGIVTILEPLLGITIACLPLFPPALRRITGHMKKIKPETRNVFPSSMDRLRLKRSKNSTFQKFDDSYLLTDLENNKTENIISGPSSKQDTLVGVYSQSSGHNIPPQSSIKIEHDWEVRSDEARCLRANP